MRTKNATKHLKNIRQDEENIIGKKVCEYVQRFYKNFDNKNVLIVGTGTGAELFYFHKNYPGSKIFGIEPYNKAVEIIEMKAKLFSYPIKQFKVAQSENIPFQADFF